MKPGRRFFADSDVGADALRKRKSRAGQAAATLARVGALPDDSAAEQSLLAAIDLLRRSRLPIPTEEELQAADIVDRMNATTKLLAAAERAVELAVRRGRLKTDEELDIRLNRALGAIRRACDTCHTIVDKYGLPPDQAAQLSTLAKDLGAQIRGAIAKALEEDANAH
jgi:hypothetical protein